jgi:hypothetical protein
LLDWDDSGGIVLAVPLYLCSKFEAAARIFAIDGCKIVEVMGEVNDTCGRASCIEKYLFAG